MTPEERAEAKRLCDEATPGPWSISDDPEDQKAVVDDLCLIACRVDAPSWKADGAFIAASRTLVPKLLDAIETAERERDELRAALKAAKLEVADGSN